MKDQEYIEFHGTKYPLVFDLNVMQDIQEEYGTFDEWARLTIGIRSKGEKDEKDEKDEKVKKVKEHNTKAVLFAIMCMINEGIDIENEEKGTNLKPVTLRQTGRIMTEVGMAQTIDKLQQVIIKSTDADKSSKNE